MNEKNQPYALATMGLWVKDHSCKKVRRIINSIDIFLQREREEYRRKLLKTSKCHKSKAILSQSNFENSTHYDARSESWL